MRACSARHEPITDPGAAGGFTDVRRLYTTPGLAVPARVLCPAVGPHDAPVA